MMILTYRYRIEDGGTATRRALRAQARAVNYVWNYCCEIDREAHRRWKAGRPVRRPTSYDLANLCRGVTGELGIHSDTVDAVCARFADARKACFPRTPRFRSFKRSLDWVPFSNFKRPAKLAEGVLTLMRRRYRLWQSRPLPDGGRPTSWCLSVDARERWYANIQVEVPEGDLRGGSALGLDLGLKDLAVGSDGSRVPAPRLYRAEERRIALHQKQGQRGRTRALQAKVRNRRRHFLHTASTGIVRRCAEIYVGDVSASRLARCGLPGFGKSVLDASWSALRGMLQYKSIATGARCAIVSERFSSQACSCCRTIPASSPKGRAALGVRHWDCSDCGATHDRDVNAARNILAAGAECRPPVAEILALEGGEGVKRTSQWMFFGGSRSTSRALPRSSTA